MNDDFGIGGGLKDGPRVFQLFAQHFSVDQIAVMRDCDRPLRVFDDKRLNIFQMTLAGRRITIVTDCPRASNRLITSSWKTSATRPICPWGIRPLPSEDTMPHDSWPRCWSA